jgi:hypothetical protein
MNRAASGRAVEGKRTARTMIVRGSGRSGLPIPLTIMGSRRPLAELERKRTG